MSPPTSTSLFWRQWGHVSRNVRILRTDWHRQHCQHAQLLPLLLRAHLPPLACLLVDSFCQHKHSDLCLGGWEGHLSKRSHPEPLKTALWRTHRPQGTTLEIHTQPWRRRKVRAWFGTMGTPMNQWVASGTIGKVTSSFGGDLPASLMRPGEMALQARSCAALGTHKDRRLLGCLLFHLSSKRI